MNALFNFKNGASKVPKKIAADVSMSGFSAQKVFDGKKRRPASPWEAYGPKSATTRCSDRSICPFLATKSFRSSRGPLLPDGGDQHLSLPSEILGARQSRALRGGEPPLFEGRVNGASSCKAAIFSDNLNATAQRKGTQRFRSLPSNSQQSVYYTCCPSVSSEDESNPGGDTPLSDLWSLPLRSCLSDTNIPINFEMSKEEAPPPAVPPFFLQLSPRPFCAWRSATPAWQVLMRRMVGRSRKAAPPHIDEPPTAPSSSLDDPSHIEGSFLYTHKSPCVTRDMTLSKPSSPLAATITPTERAKRWGQSRVRLSTLGKIRQLYVHTAAAVIQKRWRSFAARKLALVIDEQRIAKAAADAAAIKIQAHWRGCTGRWKAYLVQQINLHHRCREAAAIRLQGAWRRWKSECSYRLQRLVKVISHMRQLSSIAIQKAWRGYIVRKVLEEEWSRWVIKWVWDPAGRDVQVIGDFTDPPWLVRIPMKYCPIRRCYTTTVNRKAGRYELKFCVDGRYVCCGASTVVEDGAGHYNNVVDVYDVQKESPFVRSRRVIEETLLCHKKELGGDGDPRVADNPCASSAEPPQPSSARKVPSHQRHADWPYGCVEDCSGRRRKRRKNDQHAPPNSETEASDMRSDKSSTSSSQFKGRGDRTLSIDINQNNASDPQLPARRGRRRRRRRRKSRGTTVPD